MADIRQAYSIPINAENKDFVNNPYRPAKTICPNGGVGCGGGPEGNKCRTIYDLSTPREFGTKGAGKLRTLE